MEMEESTSVLNHNKLHLTNFMDSCRICMARNLSMKCCIFENENIVQEILYCTGVYLKQEDGLPSKICDQCVNDLSVAHKFKTSCLLADETFHKNVTKIKNETVNVLENEYELNVEFEEQHDDDFEEKVKKEDIECIVQDVRKSRRVKRLQSIKSETKPKAIRRVGRPKTTSRTPRALKKFKYKRLHCEPCDIKFDTKEQSDTHKKEVHKDCDNWVCEICGKMFIHRSSHYTHIKSHLPPKYGCDQCDYKTWHKHDLVKHIRIHTGIKLYQCEYCTSSYYTSSNLTNHIRRHHIKERPRHSCHICRMTFYDKTKLNRHIDSHNEVKRHECEVCGACFTRRCYWKKHLLRQHDILIPPQRPGRQKTNALVGEQLIRNITFTSVVEA